MPGEFFEDRELERELLDEFPTPLADLFDDLTYERAPRGRLAKIIDLFRASVRLLALYALAATETEDSPPEVLARLRKLLRQRLSEGDWLGLARESVRPFARTPAPFPIAEIAGVFFRPGTDQPASGAGALERLLKTRNEWAHGVSGTEAEVQAIVDLCRPDLETVIGLLRWMTRGPWFVAETATSAAGGGFRLDGRRLVGATPRRGFRHVSVSLSQALEPEIVYLLGPAGALRLGPLVQWLAPPDTPAEAGAKERVAGDQQAELFLLEAGGRREARLQAFPSGREVASREAQEWLSRRAAVADEPEEGGPRFDVRMIDRASECEQFRRLLRRVMEERQGQLLVLEGEAGIGKTKFSRFCREAAAPLQVRVMQGAYRDHAGGAYAGVREALEDLFGVEMLERDAVAQRVSAALPELGYAESAAEAADLTAFLTDFLRPLPAGGPGAPGDAGVRIELSGRESLDYIVGRIERFLRRAGMHQPLLLLLEDLHWADAESLALLLHLAAVLATDPARLLIIGTVRAEDLETNPALETTLQRMARFEGVFHRRRFSRLDEEDTATLIEESLQADLEDKAAVYRLAEGNPLHVLSILRYLSSEELLEATSTGWRVKPGVTLAEILPATAREVIGLRIQRVATQDAEGPARREALAWAAAAGRRFDAEVLADAIREGAPHLSARLDAYLDTLLAAGLLRECPCLSGDVLEFDHHLLREVVLAQREGPRAERARHRHLAHAKLRRIEHGERDYLPEVAHHFLEAREWGEAIRYHHKAGDAARDGLAFREAAGFYETAVRLLQAQPDVSIPAEGKADLFEAQAEALETLGLTDEALAAYRSAQAAAGADRVRWARNERCVAWLLNRKGRLDEAASACERAREVLAEDAASQASLPESAADQPDDAKRARTPPSEVDEADVLRTLGQIEIRRGRYEAAASFLHRSLALCERAYDRERLARGYGALAQLYDDRGELEALLEATQWQLKLCQELGRPVSIGKGLNSVAWALIRLCRHEEALPLLFGAAEIFERHHVDFALPHVYHSLAEALLSCGRREEARDYMERGLESARRTGAVGTVAAFHRLLARQAAAAGRPEEARLQFEEALRVCAEAGLEAQQAQICLEYGEFLGQAGDRAAAIRRLEEARDICRRLGTDGVTEAEAAIERIGGGE